MYRMAIIVTGQVVYISCLRVKYFLFFHSMRLHLACHYTIMLTIFLSKLPNIFILVAYCYVKFFCCVLILFPCVNIYYFHKGYDFKNSFGAFAVIRRLLFAKNGGFSAVVLCSHQPVHSCTNCSQQFGHCWHV